MMVVLVVVTAGATLGVTIVAVAGLMRSTVMTTDAVSVVVVPVWVVVVVVVAIRVVQMNDDEAVRLPAAVPQIEERHIRLCVQQTEVGLMRSTVMTTDALSVVEVPVWAVVVVVVAIGVVQMNDDEAVRLPAADPQIEERHIRPCLGVQQTEDKHARLCLGVHQTEARETEKQRSTQVHPSVAPTNVTGQRRLVAPTNVTGQRRLVAPTNVTGQCRQRSTVSKNVQPRKPIQLQLNKAQLAALSPPLHPPTRPLPPPHHQQRVIPGSNQSLVALVGVSSTPTKAGVTSTTCKSAAKRQSKSGPTDFQHQRQHVQLHSHSLEQLLAQPVQISQSWKRS
jgi:hypothetical protein